MHSAFGQVDEFAWCGRSHFIRELLAFLPVFQHDERTGYNCNQACYENCECFHILSVLFCNSDLLVSNDEVVLTWRQVLNIQLHIFLTMTNRHRSDRTARTIQHNYVCNIVHFPEPNVKRVAERHWPGNSILNILNQL